MKVVRIGIVGSEFAAGLHARALERCPGTEIVAACSIDRPSLNRFVKAYDIPHKYEDYDEMFAREDIDLVSVCAPNFLHKKISIAAIRAGKHVICEKPMATTVADAKAMVAAARKHKRLLMYAEDWLNAPAILRVKEIIDQGGIGEVFYVKAKECHNGSHSIYARTRKYCGGGAMIHLGIHPMAFARWLAKSEIVEVAGMTTGGKKRNFFHKEYGGEDWSAALVTMKNGVRAFIEGNYITHGGMDDTIEIYGSKGVIKLDLTFGGPLRVYSQPGYEYAIEKAETTRGWTAPAVDEEANLGYVNEITHFVDCVRKGKEPAYGLRAEDGAAVLQATLAVYESAATGKTVSLKPLYPAARKRSPRRRK
ncbi:MAG: Gfo/Idh/MocA family protein [Planctomycetota bacterium]|jgi:predicted dehydrogenase